jgi:hypothetical protein
MDYLPEAVPRILSQHRSPCHAGDHSNEMYRDLSCSASDPCTSQTSQSSPTEPAFAYFSEASRPVPGAGADRDALDTPYTQDKCQLHPHNWHRPHGSIGNVPRISILGLIGNNLGSPGRLSQAAALSVPFSGRRRLTQRL